MFWDRITLSFYHSMKTILLTDIIYGLRMLLRAPVFTTVAILSIALGVGANTAIFRVVDQLLLRELPVQRPATSHHSTRGFNRRQHHLAPLFTAARQDIQASIKDQGASGPSSSSGRLAKAIMGWI